MNPESPARAFFSRIHSAERRRIRLAGLASTSIVLLLWAVTLLSSIWLVLEFVVSLVLGSAVGSPSGGPVVRFLVIAAAATTVPVVVSLVPGVVRMGGSRRVLAVAAAAVVLPGVNAAVTIPRVFL
ncbi:hypothetical protein [Streptomyces sp. NPDC055607]